MTNEYFTDNIYPAGNLFTIEELERRIGYVFSEKFENQLRHHQRAAHDDDALEYNQKSLVDRCHI